MRRLGVLVFGFLLASLPPLAAQQYAALHPGTRVRLRHTCGDLPATRGTALWLCYPDNFLVREPLVGTVIRVERDTVVLLAEGPSARGRGDTVHVRLASVKKVEVLGVAWLAPLPDGTRVRLAHTC